MPSEKDSRARPANPELHPATRDRATEASGDQGASDRAPKEQQPCCCNFRLCLEYVEIKEPTGKLILSLWDDHVFIQVTDCGGNQKEFPKDPKHQKLGKGKHLWTEDLATIESSKVDDCKIDCTIAIQVRKEHLFNRILDEIIKLEAELRKALAALAKDTETLRQLGLALTPGGVTIQKAITDIIADQHLIDDLTARLSSLTKALVGTDDSLMREIGVVFAGYAPCRLEDGADWLDNILEPRGWTKDAKNQNRATLDFPIIAHDGEWHLGFAIYRLCPQH